MFSILINSIIWNLFLLTLVPAKMLFMFSDTSAKMLLIYVACVIIIPIVNNRKDINKFSKILNKIFINLFISLLIGSLTIHISSSLINKQVSSIKSKIKLINYKSDFVYSSIQNKLLGIKCSFTIDLSSSVLAKTVYNYLKNSGYIIHFFHYFEDGSTDIILDNIILDTDNLLSINNNIITINYIVHPSYVQLMKADYSYFCIDLNKYITAFNQYRQLSPSNINISTYDESRSLSVPIIKHIVYRAVPFSDSINIKKLIMNDPIFKNINSYYNTMLLDSFNINNIDLNLRESNLTTELYKNFHTKYCFYKF